MREEVRTPSVLWPSVSDICHIKMIMGRYFVYLEVIIVISYILFTQFKSSPTPDKEAHGMIGPVSPFYLHFIFDIAIISNTIPICRATLVNIRIYVVITNWTLLYKMMKDVQTLVAAWPIEVAVPQQTRLIVGDLKLQLEVGKSYLPPRNRAREWQRHSL